MSRPSSVFPLIARPRVEEMVRQSLRETPLTVLHAPIGAGKSVALSAVLESRPDAVRLDLQPWHSGAFVDALVQAVRVAREDFGRRTLGALEVGAAADALGAMFATDLRNVNDPLLIALDNVEHLAGDDTFARFLDTLLPALPQTVRLIVSGRTLPNISFNAAIVRRAAVVLGADALAFSDEEVRALAQTAGHDPSDERVEAIAHESEGWATGVALALQSPLLASAASSSDRARAFLDEALLPRLPEATRLFLEDTAVYETLDARVLAADPCAAAFGIAVATLERNGAPLVRTGPHAYRVHAVLRLLGLDRLRARGGESSAHARAAAAYSNAGELTAALFHANASGDEDALEPLLREHGEALVRIVDARTMTRALGQLRSDRSQDVRPFLEALLAKASGDDRAAALFDRARAAADRYENGPIAFAARAQTIERAIGQLSSVDEADLVDLEGRAAKLGLGAHAQSAMYRGWQRAVAHDFRGALDAIEPLAQITDPGARFNLGILCAYALIASGEIESGLADIDALVRLFEDDDRIVLQTLTLVWQSRFALLAGRTILGGDAGRAAQRLVESLSVRAEEAALFAALAELATHEGDVTGAVRSAERARAAATHAWYSVDVNRTRFVADSTLARAAFLGHDNAIARDLAVRAADAAVSPVQRAAAGAESLAYQLILKPSSRADQFSPAMALLAAADPVDAADAVMLATATDIVAFFAAAERTPIEPLAPPAPAFARLIERRRGLVTLEHAGIALANLRAGSGTAVAFDLALERIQAGGPRFEARLARAYAAPFVHGEREAPAPASYELTPREAEILTLLVEGLSNKEIAQRLVLSPRTAETHVERVLGKLEVPSRSRAIAKALRLGLVTLPA